MQAQTYTGRYTEGSRSRSMVELIAERGEDPRFVGADDAGNELYVFAADATEVIVTNAGLVSEADEGFDDARAAIVG